VITSSKHSKLVFEESKYDMIDNTKGTTEKIEIKKPIEILFEGADVTKYVPLSLPTKFNLKDIPENFCFLNVGHWLPGALGHDRKNIGLLVRLFFETYKNKPNPPALILKTSMVTSSILDRNKILSNIEKIKNDVKGTLPNIYLLHGDLTDEEMNELYNNSKVKAMISLTKGEGFGRPLLEFSLVNKPIIASYWSGHTDFLNAEFVKYVGGNLTNVHPSAAVDKMILQESQWFTPSDAEVGTAYRDIYENYKKYVELAKRQGFKSRSNFSYEKMRETLDNLLTQSIPEFPKQIQLKLPQLRKVELPKLKKTE
jgi:glycosyltransferase involved in cell wall biosynthesis